METYNKLLDRFDGALIEKELLNDELKELKESLNHKNIEIDGLMFYKEKYKSLTEISLNYIQEIMEQKAEIKEQKEVVNRLLKSNIKVENNYVLGLKDTIKEQKEDIKRLFEKINTLNNKVNNNINLTSKGVK
jgi:chromosome segregation ATPase